MLALEYSRISFSMQSLIDSLHARKNIPTVLKSLGCIVQHCTSTTEVQEITCHILEEIFQVTDVSDTINPSKEPQKKN